MKKIKNKIVALILAVALIGMATTAAVDSLWFPFANDDEFTTGQLDPVFYAATYPDVVAMVGTDPLALFIHYADHGMAEGRIPYAGAAPGAYINGYIKNPTENVTPSTVGQTDAAVVADGGHDLSDWTPEQLAMRVQKQQEFDSSGLVHVGWTEEQVYERLMALKEIYPEGTKVGICVVGSGKITSGLYGPPQDWWVGYTTATGMELVLDKDGNRVMPVGYVENKSYTRVSGKGNIRDVRVGDVIQTPGSGGGHVQVVLSHDDKGITVVESNIGGDQKMHWGRRMSWEELENGGSTAYQRAHKWSKITHYMY